MNEHQELYRRVALALAAAEKDAATAHPGGLDQIDYVQYYLMGHLEAHGVEICLADGELTA